jgi:hypothetical protein
MGCSAIYAGRNMMPTGLEILSLNITAYTLNNPNVIRLDPHFPYQTET